MESKQASVLAACVLAVAALLLFVRLGEPRLWMDEAETALLARSTLHHGIPKALDGATLISQEVGKEFGPDLVWRWTPWLDKYLAAASFLVAGEGTASARFPFALAGLLSVVAVYPLAFALFRDRRVALLAMAFLTLSVPFLLHARQCRYYSLAILGFTAAAYFLTRIARGHTTSLFGFAAAMSVVFHSNYMTFAAAVLALSVGFFALNPGRRAIVMLACAGALLALLNVPWAIYFHVLSNSADAGRTASYLENLRRYAELTLRYSFPGLALLGFCALLLRRRVRAQVLPAQELRPFLFLLIVPVVQIAVIAAGPWSFYRYAVNLVPFFSILLAFLCVRVASWSRALGVVATACLLLTGFLYEASAWPLRRDTHPAGGKGRSLATFDRFLPLGNFVYELAHPVRGATGAIVEHLRSHARPGERAFLSYGELVARFYTDLEIRGGMSGQRLDDWPMPEWIIVRRFFRFGDRPHLMADAERMAAWLQRSVPWESYQRIDLPVPDIPWESIPEPQWHWFRAPEEGQGVQIFRRVSAGR